MIISVGIKVEYLKWLFNHKHVCFLDRYIVSSKIFYCLKVIGCKIYVGDTTIKTIVLDYTIHLFSKTYSFIILLLVLLIASVYDKVKDLTGTKLCLMTWDDQVCLIIGFTDNFHCLCIMYENWRVYLVLILKKAL